MRPNTLEMSMEQRSKEWYKAREGRITGSAIGAILGLSPFANASDVLRRMVREYHGQPSEFTGNIATQWGTDNEPNALADFKMLHGDVQECGFYVHPQIEWLGASPDGLIGDDGLIEIKCPFGMRHSADGFKPIMDQMHYYAQVQYQLYITGREWCKFYQWSPYGAELEHVNYDQQFIADTLPSLEEFYRLYIDERKPENAWRYIDGGDLVHRYKLAKAALEVAQAELEEAKQALIDATNGDGGQIGDIKITKASRAGSIAYAKAIKDLLPDADLEAYRGKPSEYWVVK
jgi:putative phage-type endonuclease